MKKIFVLFVILLFTFILAIPQDAYAQTSSGEWPVPMLPDEGFAPWSEKDIREWREGSSSISNKINDLDNDRVINVPVPILFGVTPDNLTRNFGDPRSGGRTHKGLDIMAPRGAPIVTPTEAVVIRIGTGDSAGKYVYTANPGGETFAYMHLDEIADINEGDELQKGELIGYVGDTGNALGGPVHLHFEIRYDHDATDPYPRLTRIFPLSDKIEYLEDILNNADNEEELAEDIVTLYRKELILAQTLDIPLPASIIEIFTKKRTDVLGVSRTLRIGMSGDDVKSLQLALGISADGNFGPKTKEAVIAFQRKVGLTPDGILGPITRLALVNSYTTQSLPTGCTSSTTFSPTTGVKCISN